MSRAVPRSTASNAVVQHFTLTAQCLDVHEVDHLAGETITTYLACRKTTNTRTDDGVKVPGKRIRAVPRGEMTGGTTSGSANANDGETENDIPEMVNKVNDDLLRHVPGVRTSLLLGLKPRSLSTRRSLISSLLVSLLQRPTL